MEGDPVEVPGRRAALCALKGAVKASPSTCAGQPPSRYPAATGSRTAGSVTRSASPSSTTSPIGVRTEIVHAGFAARFRDLRVPGPLTMYRSPSCHSAPTPAECGRPSGRTVPRYTGVSGFGSAAFSASRTGAQASSPLP
ncbi:hypothetical protein LUX39_03890 [Actinomadura madurae]|nr:hypothetical protein [Actinomadura madurae]MCP9964414.1 hypothetical protein [Actinomadura madurae]MCQ0011609.1 hypothetical protein [Actinomadura madurae]MCQ0013081.1 hypothetical protein [Actinomadura madurae]